MAQGFTRRTLLKAGAGLATLASCGQASRLPRRHAFACPWPQPLSGDFPVGIASGDADETGVRITTCHQGDADIVLSVMSLDGTHPKEEVAQAALSRGDGGFMFHDVTGLQPNTRHAYAFLELDAAGTPVRRSPMGLFKTAPRSEDAPPVMFTASSCSKRNFTFEPLLRAAELDVDFHLLLGDTSYNDGAHDLASFRERWRATLSKPGYPELLSSTHVVATWDDHEIHDNWEPDRTPVDVVRAARQAFLEHVPLRAQGRGRANIWRSLRWGRTAEVFMLDLRSEHFPDANQLISPTQMDFLKTGLKTSNAVFKIIGNPVPISSVQGVAGRVSLRDRWGGYPSQREEILSFIDHNRIQGVLWVSGDVHHAAVGRVSRDGFGQTQTEVAVGPAGQVINPMFLALNGSQWDFAGGFNNVGAFQLDPQRRQVTVTIVDRDGDERFTKTYSL
jgi:alkaline phosphatase D